MLIKIHMSYITNCLKTRWNILLLQLCVLTLFLHVCHQQLESLRHSQVIVTKFDLIFNHFQLLFVDDLLEVDITNVDTVKNEHFVGVVTLYDLGRLELWSRNHPICELPLDNPNFSIWYLYLGYFNYFFENTLVELCADFPFVTYLCDFSLLGLFCNFHIKIEFIQKLRQLHPIKELMYQSKLSSIKNNEIAAR